jgi:lycopene beta-cyclase
VVYCTLIHSMPNGSSWDYIICGAGASGLALAYQLGQMGLRHKRVLLLERAPKTLNDRTWCFWEIGDNPFEAVVHKRWNNIWFHGPGLSKRFDIAPYAYKMIRGADFYGFMMDWIQKQPNIELRYGDVQSFEEPQSGARVRLNDDWLEASWIFNSIYKPEPPREGFHYLLQHFKGWFIRTAQPVFDVNAATFMDFRVPQNGETRFVYVLPTDEHTALVEYTLFSRTVLPDHEYDDALRAYLREFLQLEHFEILESEFGIIPMTDAPFPERSSPHVIHIGTAGGRSKASTGYTFQRILRQSRVMAQNLRDFNEPLRPKPLFDRHAWQDAIMLRVLDEKRQGGAEFFSDLFKKNTPQHVLRFLDEDTSVLEDLQLMSSVDIPVFTKAAFEVIGSRLNGLKSVR